MIRTALTGIVFVITIITVKNFDKTMGMICALAGSIVLLVMTMPELGVVYEQISTLTDKSGVNSGEFAVLIKVLGIAIVTEFASDLCEDAGEKSIGSKIQLAGKISVLAVSVPVLNSLIQLVERIMP